MYDLDCYSISEWAADNGYIHEDDTPNEDHCKEMLKGIIEALYTTGNTASLEDCLDELANQFDMKIPETEPVLERSASIRKIRTLNSWLNFNQECNETLMKEATS